MKFVPQSVKISDSIRCVTKRSSMAKNASIYNSDTTSKYTAFMERQTKTALKTLYERNQFQSWQTDGTVTLV